jgi:hypothetical protein
MARGIGVLAVCLLLVVVGLGPGQQPAAAQDCPPAMAFVEDATIPDGTVLAPSAPFEKVWRVKNAGSCSWTAKFSAVLVGGDALGAAATQPLGHETGPGEVTPITMQMKAPDKPGTYTGWWQLTDEAGKRFGTKFSVQIVAGTSTSNVEPLPRVEGGLGVGAAAMKAAFVKMGFQFDLPGLHTQVDAFDAMAMGKHLEGQPMTIGLCAEEPGRTKPVTITKTGVTLVGPPEVLRAANIDTHTLTPDQLKYFADFGTLLGPEVRDVIVQLLKDQLPAAQNDLKRKDRDAQRVVGALRIQFKCRFREGELPWLDVDVTSTADPAVGPTGAGMWPD